MRNVQCRNALPPDTLSKICRRAVGTGAIGGEFQYIHEREVVCGPFTQINEDGGLFK